MPSDNHDNSISLGGYLAFAVFIHLAISAGLYLLVDPLKLLSLPQEPAVTWVQLGASKRGGEREGFDHPTRPQNNLEERREQPKPIETPEKKMEKPRESHRPWKPAPAEKKAQKEEKKKAKLPSEEVKNKKEAKKSSEPKSPKSSKANPTNANQKANSSSSSPKDPKVDSEFERKRQEAFRNLGNVPGGEQSEGPKAGPGSPQGLPAGRGSNQECGRYVSIVTQRIRFNWRKIIGGAVAEKNPKLSIRLSASGQIVGAPQWVQKSGNFTLDQSAIRAVQSSAPFSPPPSGCERAVQEEFVIEFRK